MEAARETLRPGRHVANGGAETDRYRGNGRQCGSSRLTPKEDMNGHALNRDGRPSVRSYLPDATDQTNLRATHRDRGYDSALH